MTVGTVLFGNACFRLPVILAVFTTTGTRVAIVSIHFLLSFFFPKTDNKQTKMEYASILRDGCRVNPEQWFLRSTPSSSKSSGVEMPLFVQVVFPGLNVRCLVFLNELHAFTPASSLGAKQYVWKFVTDETEFELMHDSHPHDPCVRMALLETIDATMVGVAVRTVGTLRINMHDPGDEQNMPGAICFPEALFRSDDELEEYAMRGANAAIFPECLRTPGVSSTLLVIRLSDLRRDPARMAANVQRNLAKIHTNITHLKDMHLDKVYEDQRRLADQCDFLGEEITRLDRECAHADIDHVMQMVGKVADMRALLRQAVQSLQNFIDQHMTYSAKS